MFRLIIADDDQQYIETLADYITLNHQDTFQVECISEEVDFKEIKEKPVDILLASSRMLKVMNKIFEANTVVLLNEGKIEEPFIECSTIYKYMRADKIVSEILDIYSENNPSIKRIYNKNSKTVCVCTYSAGGGTGKSIISVALAIRFAQRGLKAFYLNLEEIQSTSAFFDSNHEKNMSHVFYYLKENRNNLSMKIQALCRSDELTNVHYFSALENALEYCEMSVDEIDRLVAEVAGLNFDYIFIDCASGLDFKKISLFAKTDVLLNISTNDQICRTKNSIMERNIEEIEKREEIKIREKTIHIKNKSNYLEDGHRNNFVEIPFEADLHCTEGTINLSNKFGEAINDLSNRIIEFARRGFFGE